MSDSQQLDIFPTAAVAAWKADHPRSAYGLAVIAGEQCLSGADLTGKARSYGGRYAATRRQAVEHALAYGAHVRRHSTGRLELVWGMRPDEAIAGRPCSVASSVWEY